MQHQTAIVAARATDEQPATAEARALAEAAGYEVTATLTQTRPEDPAFQFGRGKADELAARAAELGVDAVVFDNDLTPTQACTLAERCPGGVAVLDRRRLVLDIFAEQAGTRTAKLQVERARLRYERPRIEEARRRELDGETAAHDEDGKSVEDVKRRIDELSRKLAAVEDRETERRERRREEGFDLVSVAGYTNAGKSTLLHRLADDLDVAAVRDGDSGGARGGDSESSAGTGPRDDGDDLADVASVRNRLFETLETTTRRATVGGRRLLVTDTVGLVDGVPHELVRPFRTTLDSVASADAVVLVVDASDPVADVRRKTRVSASTVETDAPVVPVLNKVDLLEAAALDARREAVAEALDGTEPVAASVVEGTGLGAVRRRLLDALPTERATLTLPNGGETMSLVSWAYDHVGVTGETYGAETVSLTVEGNPRAVERVRRRAESLRTP
ncbi:MAG: GTPase HflX [Haloferacaceae archaeon]